MQCGSVVQAVWCMQCGSVVQAVWCMQCGSGVQAVIAQHFFHSGWLVLLSVNTVIFALLGNRKL